MTRETLWIVVTVGWAIVIPAWVFIFCRWRKGKPDMMTCYRAFYLRHARLRRVLPSWKVFVK